MYTTVYELNEPALWKAYLTGSGVPEIAIFAAIAVCCAIYGIARRRPLWVMPLLPALFIGSFWAPMLGREVRYGQRILALYTDGQCQMTEGVTHVLARQRPEGHSIDRIEIGGVPLEVSHYELGPQYRDSIVFGGVLNEGIDARVWYCPQLASTGSPPIVRVDIKTIAGK